MNPLGFPPEAIPLFQQSKIHDVARLLHARPRTMGELADELGWVELRSSIDQLRNAGLLQVIPGGRGKDLYALASDITPPACPLPSGKALTLARQLQATPGKELRELAMSLPGSFRGDEAVTAHFLERFARDELISTTTTTQAERFYPSARLLLILRHLPEEPPA